MNQPRELPERYVAKVLKPIKERPGRPTSVIARFPNQSNARRAIEMLIDAGKIEADAKLVLRAK